MTLFLKNALFTVLVPGTVAVYVPFFLAMRSHGVVEPWGVRQYLALLPWLVGAAIYFRCLWDFAVTGGGTPAPIDAPRNLVVVGLFRYVRNPMYIGVLFVIFGWALCFGSTLVLAYGLAVWAMFHAVVVLIEEPSLRRQFGASYTQYCRGVGRWIPSRRAYGAG